MNQLTFEGGGLVGEGGGGEGEDWRFRQCKNFFPTLKPRQTFFHSNSLTPRPPLNKLTYGFQYYVKLLLISLKLQGQGQFPSPRPPPRLSPWSFCTCWNSVFAILFACQNSLNGVMYARVSLLVKRTFLTLILIAIFYQWRRGRLTSKKLSSCLINN